MTTEVEGPGLTRAAVHPAPSPITLGMSPAGWVGVQGRGAGSGLRLSSEGGGQHFPWCAGRAEVLGAPGRRGTREGRLPHRQPWGPGRAGRRAPRGPLPTPASREVGGQWRRRFQGPARCCRFPERGQPEGGGAAPVPAGVQWLEDGPLPRRARGSQKAPGARPGGGPADACVSWGQLEKDRRPGGGPGAGRRPALEVGRASCARGSRGACRTGLLTTEPPGPAGMRRGETGKRRGRPGRDPCDPADTFVSGGKVSKRTATGPGPSGAQSAQEGPHTGRVTRRSGASPSVGLVQVPLAHRPRSPGHPQGPAAAPSPRAR